MKFFPAIPLTKFTQPEFLKKVSVAHYMDKVIPAEVKPDRVANYLLLSEKGAITRWHIDFSFTSVCYFLMTGTKEFYVVPANEKNQTAFEKYSKLKRK